ncbi:MAG: hypothetical protein K6A28_00765 [Bacteroidales bacterium]|nr:hypothetical protein [Bacteroidales bacterium]
MLFDLFKSKLPEGYFQGFCDIHSHLLPGVDDGFPTTEKTLEALSFLHARGVKSIKMTPHFMKDYPENTRESIERKFEGFIKDNKDNIPMELSLGGEYMLDSHFPDRIAEGPLCLDKDNSIILCETSYMMMEPLMKEMLYDVMLKGYQPLIAHPERYQYASKPLYQRWKQKDYMFQLNLLSLAGAYGPQAQAKAHQLLKDGAYDYVGSDLHRLNNLESMIRSIRLSKKELEQLTKLIENNTKL